MAVVLCCVGVYGFGQLTAVICVVCKCVFVLLMCIGRFRV